MQTRTFRLALAASAALVLASCATASRFEWGGYEGSLYAYSKKPELRAQYRTALEKAITEGRRTNRLAPGLCAELGYLALEDGDSPRAVELFEQEMAAFPESRPFLSNVVARARAQPKKAAIAS
jgi:hypothetical protein